MNVLKKFALLGLVAPLLFSLFSFTNASGDTVMIRVYEVGFDNPRIMIITKDEVKQIKLEQSYKNETKLDKNWQTVLNTLDQYFKEGYKVENSTATVHTANNQHITTYILTK